jgi:hypothetical protein
MSFDTELSEFIKKLNNIAQEATSKELLKPIAEETVSEVKTRIRAGYGVEDDGSNKSKFKPLKDSTKKSRKKSKLAGGTTPAKSNLTHTGELVDSIEADVTDAKITLELKGERNQKVASYVSGDRPFLHLSKQEIQRFIERFQEALGKLLS